MHCSDGLIRGDYGDGGHKRSSLKPAHHACIFGLGIAISITLVVVPIALLYTNMAFDLSDSFILSPGESSIIASISTLECHSLTLSSGKAEINSSLALYLLNNVPTLGTPKSFVIPVSKKANVTNGYYQYWRVYLYPGSNYSLEACLTQGNYMEYYVIKGTETFNKWKGNPSNSSAFGNSTLNLTNQCKNNSNHTASLNFSSEDDYYFIFYNNIHGSAVASVSLAFNRTEYLPESGGIVSNCSVTKAVSSCSLDIPFNSDYTILIVTSPKEDGDSSATVDVIIDCVASTWVYVVFEIGMILTGVTCLLCIYGCSIKIKNHAWCFKQVHVADYLPVRATPTLSVPSPNRVEVATMLASIPLSPIEALTRSATAYKVHTNCSDS